MKQKVLQSDLSARNRREYDEMKQNVKEGNWNELEKIEQKNIRLKEKLESKRLAMTNGLKMNGKCIQQCTGTREQWNNAERNKK